MKDENNKKNKTSVFYLVLLLLIGLPVLAVILIFVILLSPFLTLGYVFCQWINYLNDRNRRKINLKLKLRKYGN